MVEVRGKPFEKGQSGNPGGRPKSIASVVKLARDHTEQAVTTLVEIAKDGKSESARVAAASAILDRAYGKPVATVENINRKSFSQMTDEELEAIARGETDGEGAPDAEKGVE